jgi:ATP-dependent Clp protease ATP-binding subunit ClpA
MLNLPLTPHIQGVLEKTKELAGILHRNGADVDLLFHCFLSDLSQSCSSIFKKVNIDPKDLLKESRSVLSKKRKNKHSKKTLKTDTRKLLKEVETICKENFKLDYIAPEVILMVFFDDCHYPKVIKNLFPKGDEDSDEVFLGFITECSLVVKDFDPVTTSSIMNVETPEDWIDMFDKNEILCQFAENLNLKALNNEFDKIVDFDGKIDEVATILCRKKKPNALLVGPAGTGKTSLVEGLACKIVAGDAPELIANKVIYSVSLSSMVAGTEYRGQFEKRLEDFVNEAKKYSNLILFIDEVHTLIGAGGANNNSLEASNILKPELARGTISCIGATTINEYTNTIKKDTALDRRFERVIIREPSRFQMEEILPTIVSYYENFHTITYSDEFLDNIIGYCEKYIPNKFYPDKAIDIIDHCGAQAKVNFWHVTPSIKSQQEQTMAAALDPEKDHTKLLEKLNESLEKWTEGVSDMIPEVKLCHLKDFFKKKTNPLNNQDTVEKVFSCVSKSLVGQDELLQKLKDKIILSGLGIKKTDNFSAPECYVVSGSRFSGKSYFMDLFKDTLQKHGINVLSYSGVHFADAFAPHKIATSQGNNTSICEKVLISPNSVIIIDDFHKVDNSAIPLFNQIFKHGKFQMSNGDMADFTNCKIFLTSDISNSQLSMGFQGVASDKDNLMIHPDILSLVDECFPLKQIDEKGLRRLLWMKLKRLKNRLKDNDIDLSFDFEYIKQTIKSILNENVKIEALSKKILSEITPFVSDSVLKGEKNIKLFIEKKTSSVDHKA